ncbi:MAG: hypothetical protein ABFC65_05955 [Rectinema sp.]
MRTIACKIIFYMVAFVAFFSIVACSNDPSSWYPSGKATIVSWYETPDSNSQICMITLKIENTGQSTINAYTVSFSARTDIRTYYKTISESFLILPGKSVYVDVGIEYDSNTEILAADGLSIVDEYYQ